MAGGFAAWKGFGASVWSYTKAAASSTSDFVIGSGKKAITATADFVIDSTKKGVEYLVPESIETKVNETVISFQNLALVSTVTVVAVGAAIISSYSSPQSKSRRR